MKTLAKEIETFQNDIREVLKDFDDGATVREIFTVFKGTGIVPEVPGKSPIDLIADVLDGMQDVAGNKTSMGTKFAIVDTPEVEADNKPVKTSKKPKKGKKMSTTNVSTACYQIFGCNGEESRAQLLMETIIFLAEHGVINDKPYWVERVRYKLGISAKQAAIVSGKDTYFSREIGQVAGKLTKSGYVKTTGNIGQFEIKELTPKGVQLATEFIRLQTEGCNSEAVELARTVYKKVK